jgi:hypothetical protein
MSTPWQVPQLTSDRVLQQLLKADDVLKFQRKTVFAEAKLGRPLTRLIIALSMDSKAEALMRRLGIEYQVRAKLE